MQAPTLPSGDNAKVFVWPRKPTALLALHWNGQVCHVEESGTKEDAEQRGWELYREVMSGRLAHQGSYGLQCPPGRYPAAIDQWIDDRLLEHG